VDCFSSFAGGELEVPAVEVSGDGEEGGVSASIGAGAGVVMRV